MTDVGTGVLDPAKTALLTIDLQNAFVDGYDFVSPERGLHFAALGTPESHDVVARLNGLARICRRAGIPVIHTQMVVQRGRNLGVLGDILPPVGEGLIDDGADSAALHADLEVLDGDIVLKKPRYGAFYGTDLELILREKGVDTLIIGGIATNVCAETTAREACLRDFKVLFLSDGTTTFGIPDIGFGEISADDVQRVTCAVVGFFFGRTVTVDEAAGLIGQGVASTAVAQSTV